MLIIRRKHATPDMFAHCVHFVSNVSNFSLSLPNTFCRTRPYRKMDRYVLLCLYSRKKSWSLNTVHHVQCSSREFDICLFNVCFNTFSGTTFLIITIVSSFNQKSSFTQSRNCAVTGIESTLILDSTSVAPSLSSRTLSKGYFAVWVRGEVTKISAVLVLLIFYLFLGIT